MTIYQLHLAFLDGLDKINNGTTPELTIAQRDRLINLGIERFVKTRYSGVNTKRKEFEEGFKRQSDLANLVVHTELVPNGNGDFSVGSMRNVYFVLPNDFWFSLYEELIVEKQIYDKKCDKYNTIQTVLRLHNQKHFEFNDNIRSPFHKPNQFQAFRMLESRDQHGTDNDILYVYYDNMYSVKSIIISYLKSYKKLVNGVSYKKDSNDNLDWKTLQFWFPEETHQEIIDHAVASTLENLEQPRYNSFQNQIITNE